MIRLVGIVSDDMSRGAVSNGINLCFIYKGDGRGI